MEEDQFSEKNELKEKENIIFKIINKSIRSGKFDKKQFAIEQSSIF